MGIRSRFEADFTGLYRPVGGGTGVDPQFSYRMRPTLGAGRTGGMPGGQAVVPSIGTDSPGIVVGI